MALLRLCLCLALALFSATSAVSADTLELHEQEIKAGLLYNFLKYTDWPPDKAGDAPLVMCVFGEDPFEGYLQPMAGRSVNRREITLHIVHDIAETAPCHLLYVNAGEKKRWPDLQKFLAGRSVLTVSDFTGFADAGGMIEFGHKGNHISAELNLEAMSSAHLLVQDRLLRLVTVAHAGGNGRE